MSKKSTRDGQNSRQHSQQDDRRPQQERDLQRNKQSDSGQGRQQGGTQPAPKRGRQQGQQSDASTPSGGQQNVYGEGNYAASKQYNDATRDFAKSGRVDEAARNAAPQSDADALQMQAAEAEGKRHAKGEDPALHRKSSNVGPDASRAPKPGEEE
jgi:hypothetical protein